MHCKQTNFQSLLIWLIVAFDQIFNYLEHTSDPVVRGITEATAFCQPVYLEAFKSSTL